MSVIAPSTSRLRLVLTLAAAALLPLIGCSNDKGPSFQSTDVTGADFGHELKLTGHDGKPRALTDFAGRAVVVFFGFTHCPDICPTALAKLSTVVKALGPDGERVQVLLVTVDPERDTADVLRRYVTAFHPTFLGLTGTPDEVRRVAKDFRVIAEKQPGATPDSYSVDHSSGMFVYDPKGRLRLYVAGNQPTSAIEQDLKLLLGGA